MLLGFFVELFRGKQNSDQNSWDFSKCGFENFWTASKCHSFLDFDCSEKNYQAFLQNYLVGK